ncbi:MAG: hypothetical protein GY861_02555 [bacterium]|nr:hypothetical protein [bacterium]
MLKTSKTAWKAITRPFIGRGSFMGKEDWVVISLFLGTLLLIGTCVFVIDAWQRDTREQESWSSGQSFQGAKRKDGGNCVSNGVERDRRYW